MQKAHDASKNNYWRNYPDVSTPIVQEELNRIESTIDEIDDRVVIFDTTKANQTDMLQTISNITFTRSTGVFTITKFNGTSFDIDTDLEKIAVNFDYNYSTQQLILTLIDGTYKYIDLSDLITQFEFLDTSTIHFAVTSSGQVTAEVINGSITESKLRPDFLADCRLEVSNAQAAAQDSNAWANGQRNGADVDEEDPTYHNNAKYYSQIAHEDAEAFARGTRSGVDVPPTDETYHNNSKYYSEQASVHQVNSEAWAVGERNGQPVSQGDETYENSSKYYAEQSGVYAGDAEDYKNDAAEILEQINTKISQAQFTVNFLTGNLEYTNEASYLFSINDETGNLEWEVVA